MVTFSSIRLQYVLERARAVKLSNLADFARQSGRVTRKPVPLLIADMLWCSLRYDFAFRDYAMWEVATLGRRERATWMTHPKSHRLNVAVNDPDERVWFSNKVKFYERFADWIGREWIDLRLASDDEVRAFLAGRTAVIAKPVDGVGGGGVEKLAVPSSREIAGFVAERRAAGQDLLEAVIDQHGDLDRLYPGAVNTVRMITFLDSQGELRVLCRVLRIGNGAAVDNFASGGMYTLLDADGRAVHPAVDRTGTVYTSHPVTHERIEGFQVPLFDEVLAMVDAAARRIPKVPYVGWDIAITPDGPRLIEGNHNSSVFQTPPSVSGSRTGLLAVYRDASGIDL